MTILSSARTLLSALTSLLGRFAWKVARAPYAAFASLATVRGPSAPAKSASRPLSLLASTYFAPSSFLSRCILRRYFGNRLSINSVADELNESLRNKDRWSKAKIVASFYQIVSTLPNTLAVKFPDVYESFTSFVSSIFNLEAFRLISIGCVLPSSMYGFYGSFLLTTLTPIVLAIVLLAVTLIQRVKLTPEKGEERRGVNLLAGSNGYFS